MKQLECDPVLYFIQQGVGHIRGFDLLTSIGMDEDVQIHHQKDRELDLGGILGHQHRLPTCGFVPRPEI